MTMELSFALALSLGLLFYWSRAVSLSGAIAGGLLALAYAQAPTGMPFLVFAGFVLIGTLSSRLGRQKKIRLGVFQDEKGPRNWVNAVANCGVGGVLILFSRVVPDCLSPAFGALLACGSIAATCADTCASEWGAWLGGEPRNILNQSKLTIGANGGVTWVGTFAGFMGALVIALLVSTAYAFSLSVIGVMVLAGVVGNVVDSLLGASIEEFLGRHGGAYVNALCACAGALTVWLAL